MVQFEAWHGKTLAEHEALRNQWMPQGYRFVSLSIYGAVSAPVFAAVMVKQAVPVAQREFPVMTATEWQQTFDAQAQQGYGPIILAATGTGADPRFAAVFEPQASIPLTRHGLTGGSYNDPATIQGVNFSARTDGLILSQQTPDQPLVAVGYGDDELAIAQGAGGLSGAATDVARLVAILLDTSDNASLKRVTLEQMLSEGAVLGAAQKAIGNPGPRAGFGLDWVYWVSPGVYYGQKGGLIADAASVFQFDGEWGFVALFGSTADRPNGLIYPNWDGVMNTAKNELATAADLFPVFGMPSL